MSKASFIIVPVSNDDIKENIIKTVANRDVGYWTAPAGSNGDSVLVGDQIWFVGGKNEQPDTENCIRTIGNITRIIDPTEQPDIHAALSGSWSGDWSDRKILVFRLLPLMSKDKLTYDEVCTLFNYKRLKNGSVRVKLQVI